MALNYPPFTANARMQSAAANSPWMKRGDSGNGVSLLQSALADAGYPMPRTIRNGNADGIYGTETHEVLKTFQTSQKLGVDGVAGQITIAALDRVLSARMKPLPKPAPKSPFSPVRSPNDSHYQIGTTDPQIRHDAGAGLFNTKPTEYSYRALKLSIQAILPPISGVALAATGPNATRHMKHYFGASGSRLTIDLEGMIASGPTARGRFRNEVAQAQAFVEKLPTGTHRITSKNAEGAYNYKNESRDWFFAIGGYSSWGKGLATVTSGPDGNEYELEFEYKFADKYNWDGGKSVTLAGITITDEFMAEFHRQGLAQEFICVGSLKRTFSWKAGEAIPESQYRRGSGR